jgi:hypothetical protein
MRAPAAATAAHPVDLPAAKARARRAYRTARDRGAAPTGLLDRWYADALLACQGAPPHAAIVMFGRTEALFQLLLDRLRWLDRGG